MQQKASTGIAAALGSAFFLGLSPVLGKMAILEGFSPLAVVAVRTSLAALLLLALVILFNRSALYIYPVGLLGCALAGTINGLGSLFYYMALHRLPVSVGQLLYSLYPFFVAMWLTLDKQYPSRLTIFRIVLAGIAVILLTNAPHQAADLAGISMMIIAALLYALHLPINQRVLFEVPAPTVTLYTLLSMSAVVVPAYLLFDRAWPSGAAAPAPLVALTLATFLSRLALFFGIKKIGGMQTALLGLAELLITILFSYYWLHESLNLAQWLGALGLAVSLLLVRAEPQPDEKQSPGGWFSWIRSPAASPKDAWGPFQQ